ncbi:MAG: allantoinase AllB [Chloroflexi bacterium]|nr:allantoinase AllB [Chloroflexota bacterium]
MAADLYLKNGRFITETGEFYGGMVIQGGKIAQLVGGDTAVAAHQEIDLKGKIVLPGLVDDHVHFNEPGREHWEGYTTGSMAAAAGGITTVMEMPLNATPPTINLQHLQHKQTAVLHKAVVDYALWGGLVDNNVTDLADMHAAGVIGFKGFMSSSGVDFARIDDDVLYAGLREAARLGTLVAVHAENEHVTALLGRELRADGRTDRAAWHESRPPAAELEALKRAIYWAGVTNGRLHVVHVTLAEGMRAAKAAKEAGVHVTVETCPHYLYFDEADFVRIGPAAKCAPPLRSRDEVEALWCCVLSGLVDTIASDHSPCPWADKEPGLDNIWQAWGGISGVQTLLPVLLTEGVHKRGLTLPQLVRLTSANPARIFGLYPRKGSLLPGADADLVVVDLDAEWELAAEDLFYRHKHSAYVGCQFKGKVEQTWVRGKLVYENGRVCAEPGYGQFLRRNKLERHEVG